MMKFSRVFVIALVVAAVSSCNTGNKNNPNPQDSTGITDPASTVKLALVTKDIHFPIEMKPSPDATHRLFITDLSGKIFILKNDSVVHAPFLNISNKLENKDSAPNIRGMFSMTFHPQFAKNGKLYVSYNAPTKIDTNVCKLVISEFTVSTANPDSVDIASERRVFELEGHSVQQDAGEIMFGPDGYLYISIGDNGTPLKDRKAEELNSYLGKLLRIDVSKLPYTIPADNPFVGKKNIKPEIWAYGLRRLWRFYFDDREHTFLGGDIGDKLEEEVDILQKGGNYGWPIMEGDSVRVKNDTIHSFIPPIITYGRKDGICVIGGHFYHGKEISALAGKYVFADFNGTISTLSKNAQGGWVKQALKIQDKPKNPFLVNSCDVDENGEIYLLGVLNTDAGTKGAVYKLVKL